MKITWRNSGPRRRVSRADQAVLSVGVGNRTVRSIFLSFLLLLFDNITSINNNTNSLTRAPFLDRPLIKKRAFFSRGPAQGRFERRSKKPGRQSRGKTRG